MSRKKDNPYIITSTCEAYREGLESRLEGQKEFFEEKINSLRSVIIAVGTTTTLVLGVVQIILTLWR